jgi:hypothetical protein
MNNNQVSVSELDKMVRPKSIYVTSDLLPFDADASTATYGLQEPIMAQDGFDLVFGVRSFGFNASATNISYRQRNNTLLFEITYFPPIYVYTGDGFNLNPSRNTIESKTFKIIYPDGLYTIEELFYIIIFHLVICMMLEHQIQSSMRQIVGFQMIYLFIPIL